MARTKRNEQRAATGLPLGPLVKDLLKLAYRAGRPVLLEGPTGIGKSEIVAQVAAELGIGRVVLDLSLLEPPDLVGLPVIQNGRTTYAAPSVLPLDGAGILLLEELNRAERYIQQPALQLLTGRRLHEYELPPGWLACAAINPENEDYQVTPLDPALRSRFLNLVVRADRASWIPWAESHGIHPAVLRLAREHDRFLDGVPPRTWTYVSDLIRTLNLEEARNSHLLRAAFGGYLPPAWIEVLLEALTQTEALDGLDIRQLLKVYHQTPDMQQAVAALQAEGRTDALDRISYGVLQLVDGPALHQLIGNKEFSLEAFERLLADLPGDQREQLQRVLGDQLVAATLLNVKPTDLLRSYPGSRIAEQVGGWVKDPRRGHRVQLLVKSLCHHLNAHPDVISLRNDRGAMLGLGLFLSQVEPKWSPPLAETLEKLNLRPERPRHR